MSNIKENIDININAHPNNEFERKKPIDEIKKILTKANLIR